MFIKLQALSGGGMTMQSVSSPLRPLAARITPLIYQSFLSCTPCLLRTAIRRQNPMNTHLSRRSFVAMVAGAGAYAAVGPRRLLADEKASGLKIGIQSYSLRNYPA